MTTAAADRAVVLVPGLLDWARSFRRMQRRLRDEGHDVYTVDLRPNTGTVGLDDLALQLQRLIEERLGFTRPFDLVAHSMGGLVSRFYLQRLGGLDRVRRFITLSTPHRGSILAYAAPLRAFRQMRPGSAFLEDLNSDVEMLVSVRFTSVWTPWDLSVVPASSSVIAHAACYRVPVALHPFMIRDRRVLDLVADLLAGPRSTHQTS